MQADPGADGGLHAARQTPIGSRAITRLWKEVWRSADTDDDKVLPKVDWTLRCSVHEWLHAWAELAKLEVKVVVNASRENPGEWCGYMQCTEHESNEGKRDCPVRWKLGKCKCTGLREGVSLVQNAFFDAQGQKKVLVKHFPGFAPRRGVTPPENRNAKNHVSTTPLRSIASMCESVASSPRGGLQGAERVLSEQAPRALKRKRSDSISADAIPAAGVLKKRRMAAQKEVQLRGADCVTIWANFVKSVAFDQESFKQAPLFQLFSLPVITEVDNLPPISVCISRAMVDHVQCLLKKYTRAYAMCDSSWNYNIADWPFCAVGCATQHYDRRSQHSASTGLIIGLSNLPKENEDCVVAMWQTLRAFYTKQCNIDLFRWFYSVIYDASPAFRVAHRRLMPKVQYFRDLRHQINVAIETGRKKAIEDEWAIFVAGSIMFSAWLWHKKAFHQYWERALSKLSEAKQYDLIAWVQEYVLSAENSKFSADWFAGMFSDSTPGFSCYLQQCWERMWRVLRQTLPVRVRHMDPTTVHRKVEFAMAAVAKYHQWVTPAEGDREQEKWLFKEGWFDEFNSDKIPAKCLAGGPGNKTERKISEDDRSFRLLCLLDLKPYGPENFKIVDCRNVPNHPALKKVYIVPMFAANLIITQELAEQATTYLLEGLPEGNDAAFEDASKKLGLIIKEDGCWHYTIAGARLFFFGVVPVVVEGQTNHVRCGCQEFMQRKCCGHSCYVRWLENDPKIREEGMEFHTQSEERQRANGGGRPLNLPARAALVTMDELRRRAAKRREAREKAAEKKRRCAHRAFNSPPPNRPTPTTERKREKLLSEIAGKLANPGNFMEVFTAMRMVNQHKVTLSEAKVPRESFGGRTIRDMVQQMDNSTIVEPLRQLRANVIEQWIAEGDSQTSRPSTESSANAEGR